MPTHELQPSHRRMALRLVQTVSNTRNTRGRLRLDVLLSIGLLLGISATAAAQAEPLMAHRLSAAEITELIQTRPVWCFKRSNDGKTCERVAGVSQETDGTNKLWYLLLLNGGPGNNVEKFKRHRVVEIEDAGLCSSLEQMANTKQRGNVALNELANLNAEGPPSPDGKYAWLESVSSRMARNDAEKHGVRPGEKICMQIDQVGIEHQHYVMTPVWAAGTERENRDIEAAEIFEALTSDPGLYLRK